MQFIEPEYYLKYSKEDNPRKKYYKKISTANALEVNYEEGMYDFTIQQIIIVTINGKLVPILVEEDSKRYVFGEQDTLENILMRIQSGETFSEDYKGILEKLKHLETLLITGTKKLELDLHSNYIPINPMNSHEATPDADIEENDVVKGKSIWYVEYKKPGDDTLYYMPTFCNDKKIRTNENIEYYRFVKVVEVTIDDVDHKFVYEREPEMYYIEAHDEYTEVDMAIDAAKFMIYNGQKQGTHMFNGYTPIYPFNTEDISSVFKKRQNYIKNGHVLTVTGSGDALLDLFLNGADNVTCFDANGSAKYYTKLKFYAIKAGLSYEEYLEFFLGKNDSSILNYDIYKKFSHTLDEDTKKYWDSIYEYLNTSGQKLNSNSHSLLYSIIDPFGTANCTYKNPNSYCSEENYQLLQEILKTKSLDENVRFIDAPLFELGSHLDNSKFDYIYLSNIMDFTSTFINGSLPERLEKFREFIQVELSKNVSEDGTIDIAFLKENRAITSDVFYSPDEYVSFFKPDDGFFIHSLEPYNHDDHIISFYSWILKQKNDYNDIYDSNKNTGPRL